LVVDNLLSVPFPRVPYPAGKPFPHTSFPISQPYAHPAAVNAAWPGNSLGLGLGLGLGLPQLSLNQYGHLGEGLPILP
jgi:hypothetical protein